MDAHQPLLKAPLCVNDGTLVPPFSDEQVSDTGKTTRVGDRDGPEKCCSVRNSRSVGQ